MRLVVTSVIRHLDARSKSGFLSVVDWPSGRLVARLPVPESMHRMTDPNPRGGTRGVRGVSALRDKLLVANADKVFVVDRNWKAVSEVTHPFMGGVHDILAEPDGFWACCTSADLLVKFSWKGDVLTEWDCRGDSELKARLGLQWVPQVQRDFDYREPEIAGRPGSNLVHLNSLSRGPGGLIVSLGRIRSRSLYLRGRIRNLARRAARLLGVSHRRGNLSALPSDQIAGSSSAIVRLAAGLSPEILHCVDGISVPNHNAEEHEGRLVYNDSNASCVVQLRLDQSMEPRRVVIPGEPPFVRGLMRLDARRFLVGSQAPAAIYEVDCDSCTVARRVPLGGAPGESVYGISSLPDAFDDPPDRIWPAS